jgi:hypothetical protein
MLLAWDRRPCGCDNSARILIRHDRRQRQVNGLAPNLHRTGLLFGAPTETLLVARAIGRRLEGHLSSDKRGVDGLEKFVLA